MNVNRHATPNCKRSYISWMLFDLVEGILVIGASFATGLALRGAL
jgi:hypothetical protein